MQRKSLRKLINSRLKRLKQYKSYHYYVEDNIPNPIHHTIMERKIMVSELKHYRNVEGLRLITR